MKASLFRCDARRRRWSDTVTLGPVLRNATWRKLAHKHEPPSGDCVFERAADCGVILTIVDLKLSTCNWSGEPSWFDRLGRAQSRQALHDARAKFCGEHAGAGLAGGRAGEGQHQLRCRHDSETTP
jgi:hypothetical protein